MFLEGLSLYGIGIISTLAWIFNPEVASAYYSSQLGWNPFLVGLIASAGQVTSYAIFFAGASVILKRWARLAVGVEKTRLRFQNHLESRFLLVVLFSGIVGLPPMTALAFLAPGFKIPATHFFPLAFASRYLHFTLISCAGKGWIEPGSFLSF